MFTNTCYHFKAVQSSLNDITVYSAVLPPSLMVFCQLGEFPHSVIQVFSVFIDGYSMQGSEIDCPVQLRLRWWMIQSPFYSSVKNQTYSNHNGKRFCIPRRKRNEINRWSFCCKCSFSPREHRPDVCSSYGGNHLLSSGIFSIPTLIIYLILFFKAGFGMLEAGSVRSKNTTNILTKNFGDLCLGVVAFCLVGYGLAFSEGNAWVGDRYFGLINLPYSLYPHVFMQVDK